MANDITHILYEKVNKIENSQVKGPATISGISNNYKKKNENNKKSFKKALVNARKDLDSKEEHHDTNDEIIVESSLVNLIHENSNLGTIMEEEIAKSPRIKEVIKDKSKTNSEPLDRNTKK